MSIFTVEQSSHITQQGEFVSSILDSQEQTLIENFVNWRNTQEDVAYILDVHGRGITFQSPSRTLSIDDYVYGKYDGLQLIGAGGSLQALKEGVHQRDSTIQIHPPNPSNHADELRQVLEQHRIDEHGQLLSWQRPYAPLHGMDEKEARNRKQKTQELRHALTEIVNGNQVPLFTVPELAAEGIFPGKKDPEGNSLYFQVYRVPRLSRFPSQVMEVTMQQEFSEVRKMIQQHSYFMGSVLDYFAMNEFAYMDGHLGNTSLMISHSAKSLYVTDLGSLRNYHGEFYKDRYRAFDAYTYLLSAAKFFDSYAGFCTQELRSIIRDPVYKKIGSDKANFGASLLYESIEGLMAGMLRNTKKNIGTPFTMHDLLIESKPAAIELYAGFINFYDDPQRFLEFFEQFYRGRFSP